MKTRLLIITGIVGALMVFLMTSNYYATRNLSEISQNSSDCWTTWHITYGGNPYEDGFISNSIRETISGFGVHVDDPFRTIKITKNTDETFTVKVSGAWYDDEYDAIMYTLDRIEKISLVNTGNSIWIECS